MNHHIVDTFSSAATKYSRHEETANSIERWIVRCTLVPHGYCRAKELEEGCHHLENICGLIESECGYYLLLVFVERTNCKRIDVIWTVKRYVSRSSVDGVQVRCL